MLGRRARAVKLAKKRLASSGITPYYTPPNQFDSFPAIGCPTAWRRL
ncbi:hypothetical protein QWZ13_07150 [Reinekea marina]|nr:hypothetical protein [Reinekea marina]MDN3648689.1 hypothetical protein [Reinekea marina]